MCFIVTNQLHEFGEKAIINFRFGIILALKKTELSNSVRVFISGLQPSFKKLYAPYTHTHSLIKPRKLDDCSDVFDNSEIPVSLL